MIFVITFEIVYIKINEKMTSVVELTDDAEFMDLLAESGQKLVVVVSYFIIY